MAGRFRALICARSVIAGWRRQEMHVDQLKPEAADSLQEPDEAPLIGQLGTKGCRSRAYGDLAVVEFCAQGGARLARERDLVCQ